MSLQAVIEEKLGKELEPTHLQVINESQNHNAPPGAESHFKVIVVSGKFEGAGFDLSHKPLSACPIQCVWSVSER